MSKKSNIPNNIWDLIAKLFTGEIRDIERTDLNNWLQEDPHHPVIMKEAEKVWLETGDLPNAFTPNTEKAWQQLQSKIPQMESLQDNKATKIIEPKTNYWTHIVRIAAILVLLAGVSLLFKPFDEVNPKFATIKLVEKTTMPDERTHLILSDGTEVWLNKNSSLIYPETFEGNNREVVLKGEGFFEVKHNPDKPFIVLTNLSKTMVLGTAFNIKSLNEGKDEEIYVQRGKVRFSERNVEAIQQILSAGDFAELKNLPEKQVLKKEYKDQVKTNYLAWKEKQLRFEETTLHYVAQDLNDYFGNKVSFSNQQLANCRFTGKFNNPTFEEIIKVISISMEVEYELKDKEVVLKGEGCY